MKDKLLKLIEVCIEDKSMYTHTYGENQSYRGINENIVKPRISYVFDAEYEGKSVYSSDKNFEVDLKPYHKQMDGYSINIGFGKKPHISIIPILKGNKSTQTISQHKVEGTRKNFFGVKKTVLFDVTIIHEPHHYELRCGSFAYIIEDSVVQEFYERISKKRQEHAQEEEVEVINKRLQEFKIS